MENRRIPKYRAIMETIERRIADGVYHPGQPIPSERALAKEFGTNNETSNKAIANLVASGVLYRRQGIGTFVTDQEAENNSAGRAGRIDIVTHKRVDGLFQANSFQEEIMFTIQTRLAASGFTSNIVPMLELHDPVRHLDQVDAVIGSTFLPMRLLREINSREMPLICLDFEYHAPKTRCLLVRNNGVDQMIDHLVRLGHRNIAFVYGTEGDLVQEMRRLRFMQYMALLELNDNMSRVYRVEPENPETFGRFTRSIAGVTAIMAADDLLAVQLRSGLERIGMRIPERISLTGFGNLSIAQKIYPDLTTADVNRESYCGRIINEVDDLLGGSVESGTIHFDTDAVFRGSIDSVRF